jgi:polyhydroxyalkanoate synthase
MTKNPSVRLDHAACPDPYKALDEMVHARLAEASMGLSPIALVLAQTDWAMHLAASPGRQALLARRAFELGLRAWTNAARGAEPAAPQTDARFADTSWQQWPFSALKEGFKAAESWWREAVQVEGMSGHHRHMVDFFSRQALDAASPANWAPTNPVVMKAALESGGQSGVRGWQRFVEDLQAAQVSAGQARADAGGPPLPPLPFEVGKDVAVTPGKIVFRNRLFELIQYTPTTAQVHAEPLLIVPSCIMKYYILDLSPENSMVRYLVGQGFTVFIMSWRNPDATDRDLGMQDYLQSGVMEAMAAVKACAAASRIHALGYCLGGTFLAIVAAVLGRLQRQAAATGLPQRRRGDGIRPDSLPELATVTLLAAQTDFTEPGELGVFIDDDQLKTLRETMDKVGYLSGRGMAGSFQFLNSRDLVWSRNVHRYLLGQDETRNDMMSWNADVTRLPARMHTEYLSSLFLNNALSAGHYRVGGEAVALKDIHAPVLAVGTVRDHVSPWRSVYKLHLFTDAPVTFVLAAGGHNAGIVSEPGHARRNYQMADIDTGQGWSEPEAWLAQAPMHEGSWWVAMAVWLAQRSSGLRAPPDIAPERVVCDAPGSYVMVRYND